MADLVKIRALNTSLNREFEYSMEAYAQLQHLRGKDGEPLLKFIATLVTHQNGQSTTIDEAPLTDEFKNKLNEYRERVLRESKICGSCNKSN
jgi:hypothetical protein